MIMHLNIPLHPNDEDDNDDDDDDNNNDVIVTKPKPYWLADPTGGMKSSQWKTKAAMRGEGGRPTQRQ